MKGNTVVVIEYNLEAICEADTLFPVLRNTAPTLRQSHLLLTTGNGDHRASQYLVVEVGVFYSCAGFTASTSNRSTTKLTLPCSSGGNTSRYRSSRSVKKRSFLSVAIGRR